MKAQRMKILCIGKMRPTKLFINIQLIKEHQNEAFI